MSSNRFISYTLYAKMWVYEVDGCIDWEKQRSCILFGQIVKEWLSRYKDMIGASIHKFSFPIKLLRSTKRNLLFVFFLKGEEMKTRKTVLKELKGITSNLKMYEELLFDLRDFFYKLDLYYCYKKNEKLFLYLVSFVYYTDSEICEMVPINKKGLLLFIRNLNQFVLALLETPKYQELRKLYYQKK